VTIAFRNSTAATGTYTLRTVTAALSVTVSSGSTLGSTNGNPNWAHVYFIDNSGTVEMAVAGSRFVDEGSLVTTTAEGGGGAADDKYTLYSTTQRTSVPVRLFARVKSTQATAGTWATTPSEVSVYPFMQAVPRSQLVFKDTSGTGLGTTNSKIRNYATLVSIGAAMTGATSAANGSTVTINEDGIYFFEVKDASSSGANYAGFSLNSTQLSTDISSVTAADVLILTKSISSDVFTLSWMGILSAGDVVRFHVESSSWGTGSYPFIQLRAVQVARL
jgi:hypothetical protein